MSPHLVINRTLSLNTFVLFRREVYRRLNCGVHGEGSSILLNDKNFRDGSWMNSWALTGPFAREGTYWFLGFQREICGRPGDEDFRRDSFLLNIFKKILHCCSLLFPLNLKPIQPISSKTSTLLQSNWVYFFLNCSILKWEMKFSSQTWSVHLSFFCSSLRFKVCFLLRGKFERVKTAAELPLRDDGALTWNHSTDLFKGSAFNMTGSRTKTYVLNISGSIPTVLLCIIFSPLCLGKNLS